MSYQILLQVLKGSASSGNFGHSGRPGKRGGSAGGGGHGMLGITAAMPADAKRKLIDKIRAKAPIESGDLVNFVLDDGTEMRGEVAGIGRKTGKYVIFDGNTSHQIEPANVWRTGTKRATAGSQPTQQEDVKFVNSYDDVKATKFGKGYMLTGDGKLVDISNEFSGGTNDHVGYIAMSSKPETFGLDAKAAKRMLRGYETGDPDDVMQGWDKFHRSGGVRVREFGNEIAVNTDKVDAKSLKKLQKLHDSGKLGIKPGQTLFWEGNSDYKSVQSTFEDFLNAKFVTGNALKSDDQ